ncbi:MAG: VCBS repeat-containing protein [Saprospiraceae bacterium]
MRFNLLLIISFSFPAEIFAQISFVKHLIKDDIGLGTSINAVDINNDGLEDLITTIGQDYKVAFSWWENQGSNKYYEHKLDTVSLIGYDAAVADFNADGNMDLVRASQWKDNTTIWLNQGVRGFSKIIIDEGNIDHRKIIPVDFDNDFDIDIISVVAAPSQIRWLENKGNYNFIAHIIDTSFNFPTCIDVVDFDGDNDLDILATAAWSHEVGLWINDGVQNFYKTILDKNFGDPITITSCDLDGDLKMEIVSAAFGRSAGDIPGTAKSYRPEMNKLVVWKYLGNKMFDSLEIGGNTKYKPISITSGDIDLDGDTDLVWGSAGQGFIVIYLNAGNFKFERLEIITGLTTIYDVSLSDIDLDGDLDILGSGNDQFAWWENPTASDTTGGPRILKIIASNVNVRSIPNVVTGKILFRLNTNDICSVVARTELEYEVDGFSKNKWYYICHKGRYGWVFGGLTNTRK